MVKVKLPVELQICGVLFDLDVIHDLNVRIGPHNNNDFSSFRQALHETVLILRFGVKS